MLKVQPDAALLDLLSALRQRRYQFVTPLNATARLVRRRPDKEVARSLRDVLGWNLPFERGAIDPAVEALLEASGCLIDGPKGQRATIRVSSFEEGLFLHSAYGSNDNEAVFLGPDTYRFAEFLRRELIGAEGIRRILDVGTGAGVGGVVAGLITGADHVALSDTNPLALRYAAVNAAHAGVAVSSILASGLDGADNDLDCVVANPPFIAAGGRLYSHGGDRHGLEMSFDWASAAIPKLRQGGVLLMYTGSAIIEGEDPFRRSLEDLAQGAGCALAYRELDPDIFGSQLKREAYAGVERIAAVGVRLSKR